MTFMKEALDAEDQFDLFGFKLQVSHLQANPLASLRLHFLDAPYQLAAGTQSEH